MFEQTKVIACKLKMSYSSIFDEVTSLMKEIHKETEQRLVECAKKCKEKGLLLEGIFILSKKSIMLKSITNVKSCLLPLTNEFFRSVQRVSGKYLIHEMQ